jgi:hypothetical protein
MVLLANALIAIETTKAAKPYNTALARGVINIDQLLSGGKIDECHDAPENRHQRRRPSK